MEPGKARRSDNGGASEPAVQVVGFHVEGTPASPMPDSVWSSGMGAASPVPVIIPPSFQRAATATPTYSGNEVSSRLQQQAPDTPTHSANAAAPSFTPTSAAAPAPSEPSSSSRPSAAAAAGASSLQADGASSAPPPSPPPLAAAAAAGAAAAAAAAAAPAVAKGGKKERPTGGTSGPPPPFEPREKPTRAERRERQEAQMAAKAAAKAEKEGKPAPAGAHHHGGSGGGGGGGGEKRVSSSGQSRADGERGGARGGGGGAAGGKDGGAGGAAGGRDGASGGVELHPSRKAEAMVKEKKKDRGVSLNSTELFAHLQQYKSVDIQGLLKHRDAAHMHPSVLQLGLRYAQGSITGSNDRCVALLDALRDVILDYSTPEGKVLSRDLTSHINQTINFLVDCRPLSVGMGNAIRSVKMQISRIDPSTPERLAKDALLAHIRDFVRDRIQLAGRSIAAEGLKKVYDGDVVLTYSYSDVVADILTQAAARGTRFRVVVADGRPELEGRRMLLKLLRAGLSCSYCVLNGLSFVMREVTKVLLPASAVLSNGTVVSRAGTAVVAMMAAAHNTPVLVCCETYKFHERVQLDSITNNELGDPGALLHVQGRHEVNALHGLADHPRLGLLNLKYDATPSDYVSMVVTEMGMVPTSSVLVILREYKQELSNV